MDHEASETLGDSSLSIDDQLDGDERTDDQSVPYLGDPDDFARHMAKVWVEMVQTTTVLDNDIYRVRQELTNGPRSLPHDKPGALYKLAVLLMERYSNEGGTDNRDEAIELHREASLLAQSYETEGIDLKGWSICFGREAFTCWKEDIWPASLEKAIKIGRQVAIAAPRGHPGRAEWVNNLGLAFFNRYSTEGTVVDLEESIEAHRDALASTAEDHPHKASWLTDLGTSLHSLYTKTNGLQYIEEAVNVQEQALAMESVDRHHKAVFLDNLGFWSLEKYRRTKSMADLRKAIDATRSATVITPDDSLEKWPRLSRLGHFLTLRFSQAQTMNDLEEAIDIQNQTIRAGQNESTDFPIYLSYLFDSLLERYSVTKATADLDEGIKHLRQAIDATSENDGNRILYLYDLGIALDTRYSTVEAMADREEAIAWNFAGLHHPNALATHRILAGIPIVAMSADPQQVYEVAKTVLDLVPALVFKSLDSYDAYAVGPVLGLASDAAAAALRMGEPPMVALNLLEKGRSIIPASVDRTPAGFRDLKLMQPALAENRDHLLKGAGALKGYSTARELESLFNKIRTLDGFENFLLPAAEAQMCLAASFDPIVVINVSRIRCDAFLIDGHQVRVLPLTDLSVDEIARREGLYQLGARENLEWLWDTVARPVLDALQFTGSPPQGQSLPRIRWIPTGILAKFPIHAAGYHAIGSHDTVMDRAISSYACSVSSTIHIRYRLAVPGPSTAVVVAMENTPDYGTLPHAAQDAAELDGLFRECGLRPVQPERDKQAVISQLTGCNVFHFSGHVSPDEKDPHQSLLLLGDWKVDPLNVDDMIRAKVDDKSPFFAYLSAPDLVRHGSSPYEDINIISACQLASFRHVVGPLWEVNDRIRLDVAREIYREIKGRGMTDAAVCVGYHTATRQLRDRWLRGEERVGVRDDGAPSAGQQDASHVSVPADAENLMDWVRVDIDSRSEGVKGPSWASFVHFGA